jgi:signal transduction histidine kinase
LKLLNKTSLIIVTISLFVFLGGGIVFFYSIRSLVQQETDEELIAYSNTLVQELKLLQSERNAIFVTQHNVILNEVQQISITKPFFSDTTLYDAYLKVHLPYRVYNLYADYGFKKYEISVFRATNNSEKLLERIVLAFTFMLILLIIALAVFNRFVFLQIWDDFFNTLARIKSYRVKSGEEIELKPSEIEEFQELNEVITKLMDRIHKDFHNLKEFTENVSHEIQTPLAIMRSKIELLLQDENLTESQLEMISSLYDSVGRLSGLNKVLILLTRIENNQFPELQPISLSDRTRFHMEQLEEMIESRNLRLSLDLHDVKVLMNSSLADILLMNLIKNAIRYNIDGGALNVVLRAGELRIENSGPKAEFDEKEIFERYARSAYQAESLGLGLSIVEKICQLYQMKIEYSYRNELNIMQVSWNNLVS